MVCAQLSLISCTVVTISVMSDERMNLIVKLRCAPYITAMFDGGINIWVKVAVHYTTTNKSNTTRLIA